MTLAILAYINKTHPEIRLKLRSWRRWAKGPDSWAPCVIIPAVLAILVYVSMTGFFWGVFGAAAILAIYTNYSLPGVVNVTANPVILVNLTVKARVSLVPAPTLTILGKKVPNPKYWKHKLTKHLTRKSIDTQ